MNFFSRYVDYMRNNPQGYWFKRKVYGWGWVPVKWQGWTTIAAFVAVLIWIASSFAAAAPSSSTGAIVFAVKVVLCVAALIYVCYRTGEPPTWQWGLKGGS